MYLPGIENGGRTGNRDKKFNGSRTAGPAAGDITWKKRVQNWWFHPPFYPISTHRGADIHPIFRPHIQFWAPSISTLIPHGLPRHFSRRSVRHSAEYLAAQES